MQRHAEALAFEVAAPRFDLVEVSSPAAVGSGALWVLLPNGIRCEVPSGFGRGEAADLIRELKAC